VLTTSSIIQRPVAAVLGALRVGHATQAVVGVELEDAHALERAGLARLAHVDERAFVLEPQARLEALADERAHGAQLHLLRGLLRVGAAHSPSTNVSQHEGEADLAEHQPARSGDRPEVRITVYSELAASCPRT
jgi:hypothetical protein